MTTIQAEALQELFAQTIQQMVDGGLDHHTFADFRDFAADYPSHAWLEDYRRYGGTADDEDADAIEEALMDLARERLA
jgi:hypothetical protein